MIKPKKISIDLANVIKMGLQELILIKQLEDGVISPLDYCKITREQIKQIKK